jgi:hypothetical protein
LGNFGFSLIFKVLRFGMGIDSSLTSYRKLNMMNRQSSSDNETRAMLHSVSQAIGPLRETDFVPDFGSDESASLLQSLGIRAGVAAAAALYLALPPQGHFPAHARRSLR